MTTIKCGLYNIKYRISPQIPDVHQLRYGSASLGGGEPALLVSVALAVAAGID